jgi:hypothetical protein
MAVAIASKSTSSSGTLTKPTGLAVGDLMVAVLFSTGPQADQAPAAWNTLSGWTALGSASDTIANGLASVSVQAKIAEASDVAASDFTFTGGSVQHKTQLFRITSIGEFSGAISGLIVSDFDSDASGATPTTFSGGVDPNFANSLLILGAIQNTTAQSITLSSPAVTNSNPATWTTEDSGGGGDVGFIVASATFAPATVTGNYKVTSTINSQCGGFLLSIYDSGNITATVDPLIITSSVPNSTATGTANVTVSPLTITSTIPDATISTEAGKVTNMDKSTASSVTNLAKS